MIKEIKKESKKANRDINLSLNSQMASIPAYQKVAKLKEDLNWIYRNETILCFPIQNCHVDTEKWQKAHPGPLENIIYLNLYMCLFSIARGEFNIVGGVTESEN